MDVGTFWHLIEESRAGSDERDAEVERLCEAQVERLTELLGALEPDEIEDFNRFFEEMRTRAYRWDLWGAAYLVNGSEE